MLFLRTLPLLCLLENVYGVLRVRDKASISTTSILQLVLVGPPCTDVGCHEETPGEVPDRMGQSEQFSSGRRCMQKTGLYHPG